MNKLININRSPWDIWQPDVSPLYEQAVVLLEEQGYHRLPVNQVSVGMSDLFMVKILATSGRPVHGAQDWDVALNDDGAGVFVKEADRIWAKSVISLIATGMKPVDVTDCYVVGFHVQGPLEKKYKIEIDDPFQTLTKFVVEKGTFARNRWNMLVP